MKLFCVLISRREDRVDVTNETRRNDEIKTPHSGFHPASQLTISQEVDWMKVAVLFHRE
jgi:hypothetical protein